MVSSTKSAATGRLREVRPFVWGRRAFATAQASNEGVGGADSSFECESPKTGADDEDNVGIVGGTGAGPGVAVKDEVEDS